MMSVKWASAALAATLFAATPAVAALVNVAGPKSLSAGPRVEQVAYVHHRYRGYNPYPGIIVGGILAGIAGGALGGGCEFDDCGYYGGGYGGGFYHGGRHFGGHGFGGRGFGGHGGDGRRR